MNASVRACLLTHLIVGLPLLLWSCSRAGHVDPQQQVEQEPVEPRPNWSRVVLVQIEDGTHCAVAETFGGKAVSLSCDWQ